MNFSRFRQTVFSIALSSLLFFTACQQETSGQPLTPPATDGGPAASGPAITSNDLLPLVPGMRERTISILFASQLERFHISQRKLDTAVSKEALRLYIKSLDPQKMYFYQSDIDEFRKNYELRICDLLRNKDISPAFTIYNRFLDRVKERVDVIGEILKTSQDFTIDEEIVRDKSKDFTLDPDLIREKGQQAWPATPEEAYDRWRKRIKSDLLALKAEAREKEKDREKALAEGKEPPKAGDQRDPVERLEKRYTSFRKRMLLENHIKNEKLLEDVKRAANDDVLEAYLSAIAGALDPHTSYWSYTSYENFKTSMGKSLKGIGATLTSEDGYTVVKKLVVGGPAEKSGKLHVDDKITGVGQGKDGEIEDVVDSRLTDVVQLIRGEPNTVVRLEVLPADGGASQIVEIVRDEIKLEDQAAKAEIFESGTKPDGTPYKIGVIDLPDFYLDMDAAQRGDRNVRSTTTDIKAFLKDFVSKNVDVVVLDLRMNGGGSLQEAIFLTGLFITEGNVVQTKDETSSRPQQRDDPDAGCDWTGPLVVVESKFSASASEIFAGAIKDYKRGLIIGDSRTHGKGTVQQMKDFDNLLISNRNAKYGAMKITIQGFYRPSGISPQGPGIAADVLIPSLTDALEDICESDLDNALTLSKVPQATNFPKMTPYVTPQIVQTLQQRSEARIAEEDEFVKLRKEIEIYKEMRARRSTTLNEVKYFEEMDRLNADKREREQIEKMLEDQGKIKRDFYLDEVMNISVDYVKLLEQLGIAFPKERTIQGRARSWPFGL